MVALLALVALGCEETATELVVVIDTNLHACGEVDEIALAVTGPTAMSEPLVAPLVGPDRVELPLVHGLVPGSDALGPVEIIATARYRGRDVMSERVRTELVDGEIKMVSLVLDYRCRGATFCGEDETCDAGRCVSVQRDGAALPSWDGAPAPLDHGAADLSRCRTESEGVCQPVQLVVGAEHACVLCDSGVVVCWGGTRDGQVGNGYDAPGDYEYALPIVVSDLGPPDGVAKLGSTSANDTCAMLDGGDVRCWGRNADRQIDGGDCVTSEEECSWPRLFPTAIATQPSDVDTPIRDIGIGARAACALHDDGTVVCWGNQSDLGNPSAALASYYTPFRAPGLSADALTVGWHVCAIEHGAARCFGAGAGGELGNGARTTTREVQTAVGLSRVTAIGANETRSCAIQNREDGTPEVFCWGTNATGQLGPTPPAPASSNAPLPVDVGLGARQISVGDRQTCIVTAERTVKCWGSIGCSETMPDVELADVVEVRTSQSFVCARLGSGAIECWGFSIAGGLGVAPEALGTCDGMPFSATPRTIALP